MLTPIDVQNKEFKGGIGYDKKEVEYFIREISTDYETLYRSNIELNDKVTALNESLQHYRSIEESMQKALTISEKTAEETVIAANEKARQVNVEAEKKAESIVENAKEELLKLKNEIHGLKRQYEIFKSQFTTMLESQLKLINGEIEEIDLGPGFEPQANSNLTFPFANFGGAGFGGGLGEGFSYGYGNSCGNPSMDRFAQTNQAPAFDRGPLNMDPFADALNGGGRFSRHSSYPSVSNKHKNSSNVEKLKIKNGKEASFTNYKRKENPQPINETSNDSNSHDLNQQQKKNTQGTVENKINHTHNIDSEDNYASSFNFMNEEKPNVNSSYTTNTKTSINEKAYTGDIEDKLKNSSMLDSEDNYADGFEFLNQQPEVNYSQNTGEKSTYQNESTYHQESTYQPTKEPKTNNDPYDMNQSQAQKASYDARQVLIRNDSFDARQSRIRNSEVETQQAIHTQQPQQTHTYEYENSYHQPNPEKLSDDVFSGDIEDRRSKSNMLDSTDNYDNGFDFLNDDEDIPTILSNPTGTYYRN